MVADLVALLDTAGATQAHVVGYSMGAMLAASLALSRPERVRTVTLAAGAFQKDAAAMRRLIGRASAISSSRRAIPPRSSAC